MPDYVANDFAAIRAAMRPDPTVQAPSLSDRTDAALMFKAHALEMALATQESDTKIKAAMDVVNHVFPEAVTLGSTTGSFMYYMGQVCGAFVPPSGDYCWIDVTSMMRRMIPAARTRATGGHP